MGAAEGAVHTAQLCYTVRRVSYSHTHARIHMHTFTWTHTHAHIHMDTYTCTHSHAHIHMHTFTCTHTHARIHMHAFTCTHSHAHIHMHAFTCTHTHARIHMHTFTCTHTHAHIHVHKFTCTHSHIHMHTSQTENAHTHNRSSSQIYKKSTVTPIHYTTLSLAANTSPFTSSNPAPSPPLPSPQCMGHCPLPLPPVRPVSSPLPALCNQVAGCAQAVCLLLPHPKGQHRRHADPPGQGVQWPTALRS